MSEMQQEIRNSRIVIWGGSFRCLKCKKKIRTTGPLSTVSTVSTISQVAPLPTLSDADSNWRESSHKLTQFKKETGPADVGVVKGLKILSIVLFIGGIFAILLMIVESRYGFLRHAQLDLEGIRIDSEDGGSVPKSSNANNSESGSALQPPGDSLANRDGSTDGTAGAGEVSLNSGDPDALPQMFAGRRTVWSKTWAG